MDIPQILKKLSDLENRVETLETLSQNPQPLPLHSDKQISAKEFLLLKQPVSEWEKTLALAGHLEQVMKINPFNTEDLANAFRTAREKLPTNLNDVINKNVSKGYLMEVKEKKDNKKAWLLTATGERYLETKT